MWPELLVQYCSSIDFTIHTLTQCTYEPWASLLVYLGIFFVRIQSLPRSNTLDLKFCYDISHYAIPCKNVSSNIWASSPSVDAPLTTAYNLSYSLEVATSLRKFLVLQWWLTRSMIFKKWNVSSRSLRVAKLHSNGDISILSSFCNFWFTARTSLRFTTLPSESAKGFNSASNVQTFFSFIYVQI